MILSFQITIFCWLLSLTYISSYSNKALLDRVERLPRAPPFSYHDHHFSGFLNVSLTRFIHYYYIESESNVKLDPVIFWTNGGPGCSGLIGMFTEFGPFRPQSDGSLIKNPYSWSKRASIVFLEQPVGVGFSYSTNHNETRFAGDYFAGRDNIQVIKEFFKHFPERKSNGFIVASESYGGHYVPEFSLNLLGDEELVSMFRGFMLGNPYVNWASLNLGLMNTAWGLQLLPAPQWKKFQKLGCAELTSNPFEWPDDCSRLFSTLVGYLNNYNPYALDFPVCESSSGYQTETKTVAKSPRGISVQAQRLLQMHAYVTEMILGKSFNPTSTSASHLSRQLTALSAQHTLKAFNKVSQRFQMKEEYNFDGTLTFPGNITYDPCQLNYAEAYLSLKDVQEAMHVSRSSASFTWSSCNDNINQDWFIMDFISDVTKLYSKIYNHPSKPKNFKMLVYSGDSDGVCATIGTQHWIYGIKNAKIMSLWKPWQVNGQQAGYITQFNDSLTFATVHFAGHEVPAYQPERALQLLELYLDSKIFNTTSEAQSSSYSMSDADITAVLIAISVIIGIILALVVVARALEFSTGSSSMTLSSSGHQLGNLYSVSKRSMPQSRR